MTYERRGIVKRKNGPFRLLSHIEGRIREGVDEVAQDAVIAHANEHLRRGRPEVVIIVGEAVREVREQFILSHDPQASHRLFPILIIITRQYSHELDSHPDVSFWVIVSP